MTDKQRITDHARRELAELAASAQEHERLSLERMTLLEGTRPAAEADTSITGRTALAVLEMLLEHERRLVAFLHDVKACSMLLSTSDLGNTTASSVTGGGDGN